VKPKSSRPGRVVAVVLGIVLVVVAVLGFLVWRAIRGDLPSEAALPAEIAGQARQLRRFGSPDQVERAAALLEDVKRELYAILANGPTRDEHAEGTGT
jgi:hypothetical protein